MAIQNITADLRRYKELDHVFEQFIKREMLELFDEPVDDDLPTRHDPRIKEFHETRERLENLVIESPSLVIEERELHQVFGELRKASVNSTLNSYGDVVSDELFDKLKWEYHPNHFVQRMLQARPLLTLIEVPQDVIRLLQEARKSYCLQLPTACISVCRSTVERAVLDIAVHIGRIKQSEAREELRMCAKISALIYADLTPQSTQRQDIDRFMADTSRVIHTSVKADEPEALRLYLKTLDLIQQLYGRYSKQLKQHSTEF